MGVRITRAEFNRVYEKINKAAGDKYNLIQYHNLHSGALYAGASNGHLLAVTVAQKHRGSARYWGRVDAGYSLELIQQVIKEIPSNQAILELHDEGISTKFKDYPRSSKTRLNWWYRYEPVSDDITTRVPSRTAFFHAMQHHLLEATPQTDDVISMSISDSRLNIADQLIGLATDNQPLEYRTPAKRLRKALDLLGTGRVEGAFYNDAFPLMALWNNRLVTIVLLESCKKL